MADEYFTLVFKGNLKSFAGNPLRTETPFGVPFICALGNVCDETDGFKEALEEIALGYEGLARGIACEALRAVIPDAVGEARKS